MSANERCYVLPYPGVFQESNEVGHCVGQMGQDRLLSRGWVGCPLPVHGDSCCSGPYQIRSRWHIVRCNPYVSPSQPPRGSYPTLKKKKKSRSCFVTPEDNQAYQLTFWFLPVGITLLLGFTF